MGVRIVGLTRKLVTTPSVVDTDGEAAVADVLHEYLLEQTEGCANVAVNLIDVPKHTECRGVMAFAKAAQQTAETIVLIGHTDTVGLEPYGTLAAHAFESKELKKHFSGHADPAVASAAGSNDWAFGRGWLDMKGGVAVACEVFLREARLGELKANLVLLLTPDEESASRGVRAMIPHLRQLKEEHGLNYIQIINTDYTAPLAVDDDQRYFYSGVVGKFLVGISVFGRPTHVGETFGGVNASSLAGYLAYGLEHDRKLLAGVGGEWLPPPTVLKIADRRQRYDVMIIDCAELYVNVFHLAPEAQSWWRGMLNEVRRLTNRYDIEMRKRYNRFVAKADQQLPRYDLKPEVIDYAALRQRAAAEVDDIDAEEARLREQAYEKHFDERQRAQHVIHGIHGLLPPGRPLVVVSLLPPFYPAQVNTQQIPTTAELMSVVREFGLKHKRVYPYISDLSYFCFDKAAELDVWATQSPIWFNSQELEDYAAVASRVCNLGPWGVGAHTAEERVYLPYLRDTLPKLLTEAIHRLAK